MSEPKVIWTGTYAGYAVDVRIVGGVPVQFLDGRRSMLPGDREGITNAAVVGLAAERDACRSMLVSIVEWADGWRISQDVANSIPLDRLLGEAGLRGKECATLRAERDILHERLVRIEGPAQCLVGIDNDLAEGRDTEAKASFHDAVMRPIEELRGYFAKLHRAGKRGQTIFDLEVERRKRAEQQRDALRERLAKLEATLMSIRDTGVDPRLDVGDIVEGDARKAWQDWARSVGVEGVDSVET